MKYVKKIGQHSFLEKAHKTHGDRYSYEKAVYNGSKTPLEIICHKHGSFMQKPQTHYRGGCFECGKDIRTKDREDVSIIDCPAGASIIMLTKGKYAIVDSEDFDRLNQHKWIAKPPHTESGLWYAHARIYFGEKNCKHVSMHRMVMNVTDPKKYIDHINHNTLDNRKLNLRECTALGNAKNSTSLKGSSSKYLGVSLRKNNRWLVQISDNYKKIHVGVFDDEKEAAIAYDHAATKVHGEFANLNFKS